MEEHPPIGIDSLELDDAEFIELCELVGDKIKSIRNIKRTLMSLVLGIPGGMTGLLIGTQIAKIDMQLGTAIAYASTLFALLSYTGFKIRHPALRKRLVKHVAAVRIGVKQLIQDTMNHQSTLRSNALLQHGLDGHTLDKFNNI